MSDRQDQEGHHPRQPERRPDLREVVARQEGATSCRRSTCPKLTPPRLLGELQRAKICGNMPEVSEIEIIRHFTRLSTWNYARRSRHVSARLLHDEVQRARERSASRASTAWPEAHPYQPETLSQGALRILKLAERAADRNHRHGRDHAAAGRRRARRIDGHSAGPRVSRSRKAIRARRFSFPTRRTAPIRRRPRSPATRSRT